MAVAVSVTIGTPKNKVNEVRKVTLHGIAYMAIRMHTNLDLIIDLAQLNMNWVIGASE